MTEPARDGDPPLSADRVFALLADAQRRTLCRALARRDGAVAVDQLVTDALARTGGTRAGHAAQRDRLLVRCRHVHLPRLADAGLVEWDRDAGRVEPTPAIEAIEPFLELDAPLEQPGLI